MHVMHLFQQIWFSYVDKTTSCYKKSTTMVENALQKPIMALFFSHVSLMSCFFNKFMSCHVTLGEKEQTFYL